MNTRIESAADFTSLAGRATEDLPFDADVTIAAVRTQHRRRSLRRRRALIGVPVVAVLAVGGLSAQALLTPTIPAAQAYEFGVTDAPPIIELVADLEVTYLPAEFEGQFGLQQYSPAQSNGEGAVVFETSCYGGAEENRISICVSTEEGLDLDRYLEHNWFEGAATEVNGQSALINAVSSDGAGGILFSPEVGTVVEIHLASDLAGDLRPIVAGMAIDRG